MAADLPGTTGDDTIVGTAEGDTINGGPGNDTIDGGPGNDTVNGGEGADYLTWNGSAEGGEHDTYIGGDGHVPVFDGSYVIGICLLYTSPSPRDRG